MQHSESLKAPQSLTLADVEIGFETYLWINPAAGANKGDLHGRLIVQECQGRPIPSDIRLYHFQVMRGGFGGALSNFRLDGEGISPSPGATNIVCQFLLNRYAVTNAPIDVAVSLTDKSGKHYILLARQQSIHREPPPDESSFHTFVFDGVRRVKAPPPYIYITPNQMRDT